MGFLPFRGEASQACYNRSRLAQRRPAASTQTSKLPKSTSLNSQAMHSPTADEFGNSETPEVCADDLAFISQFAEAAEKPSFQSTSTSSPFGVELDRPTAPLPRGVLNLATGRPRSPTGVEDPESEDEIEEILTRTADGAKTSTSKTKHIVRGEGPSDTKLADADAADIAFSSTDSDADSSSSDSTSDTDSDNSSTSKRHSMTKNMNKITNESHALLSAEIDKLKSTSSSRPTTVTIPAPLSDIDSDEDADDDGGGGSSRKKQADGVSVSASAFVTKHELENPPVPVVELEQLEPHEHIEPVGSIMSLVGSAVIVQAINHGSHRVLDTGSLLAFEDRKVFGAVFEAFGPVMKPMYIVRFASASDVEANDRIAVGATVFYAPDRSTFLFTSALRQMRGSDASNVYDEEVDHKEMEFSDDEEERAYKKMLEKLRKERAATSSNGTSSPSSSFYPQRKLHASTSALPSDDITDIFYGDAYDDPLATAAAGPSSPPSSSAAIARTSALDPRAARRMLPSAYDEVSPYDDPPPITMPVSGDDAEMVESHAVERLTTSRPPSGGRGAPGRGTRGRGRGRGRGDHSIPSRGRGRGRGRDRGVNGDRNDGVSWNTSNIIGLSQSYTPPPATTRQGGDEYDPRHPGFDDGLPRQEREHSPTSATIASVTGEWGSSAIDPTVSMGTNMAMLGQHSPFENGFYNPFPAPGMGASENFVAPHINPRFAAAMGGMGGAMNFHLLAQQQQMFYQQMQRQVPMQQHHDFGDDTASAAWGSVTTVGNEGYYFPQQGGDNPSTDSASGG